MNNLSRLAKYSNGCLADDSSSWDDIHWYMINGKELKLTLTR